MKRILRITIFIVFQFSLLFSQTNTEFPPLKGPYLGQKPPGDQPELFAPGIVSTGLSARDIAITPDGKEIYFCLFGPAFSFNTILCSKIEKGIWAKPEVALFANDPNFKFLEPCISHDGKKFYFVSNKPFDNKNSSASSFHIWVMDLVDSKWSDPYNIGSPINSDGSEYFPSLTKDGTIYYTRENSDRSSDIFRSRFINGKYTQPEKLPKQVNCGQDRFNAFIAPDESYIIVSVYGGKDSKGATDYYIVLRNPDDSWSEPINMGDGINSTADEYSPYVSPDGKYFFFMSRRFDKSLISKKERLAFQKLKEIHNLPGNGNACIYWVDAKIINELKMKKMK